MAGVGVLPWILFVLGLADLYRPIFHSVGFRSMFHPLAEVQGFLACFALGAVLTLLPRRTGASPPSAWQIAVAFMAPIAVVISAAVQRWRVGQLAWIALLATVIHFVLRAGRSRPIMRAQWPRWWIGLGVAAGLVGALLAVFGDTRQDFFWAHEVGRALLTQGLFTALTLGGVELLLSNSSDERSAPLPRLRVEALLAFASFLYFASFALSARALPSWGFALRAAVTFGVVLYLVRVSRLSAVAGPRGRAARIALWMLPLGNAWAALMPASQRAGMHLIYLACFGMLILVISSSLSATAENRPSRPLQIGRQLGLGWACLAVALGSRILVEIDPPNFRIWLGISCLYFLLALLLAFTRFADWLVSLLP